MRLDTVLDKDMIGLKCDVLLADLHQSQKDRHFKYIHLSKISKQMSTTHLNRHWTLF